MALVVVGPMLQILLQVMLLQRKSELVLLRLVYVVLAADLSGSPDGRNIVNGGQLALAIVGQVLKRLPHEVLVQVLQQMLGQELQRVLQHLVQLVLVEELLQGADQVDHVLVAILR